MKSTRWAVVIVAIISASALSAQSYKTQLIHYGPLSSNATLLDDFDHDGDPDVIVVRRALDVNPPAIEWLENEPSHQFPRHVIYSDSTMSHPVDIKKCDCDGDGRTDYVISESAFGEGQLFIIQRQADNTFVKWTVEAGPAFDQLDIGDFNHDGKPDIVAVGTNQSKVNVYLNNGGFSFTKTTLATAVSGVGLVQAVDIDGDGDVDIVCSGWIFHNNGNATFDAGTQLITYVFNSFARGMQVVDLNGDGKLDVMAFSGSGTGGLYYFDGAQNYAKTIIDAVGIDLGGDFRVADIDGNGLQDVIRQNIGDNQLTILYQDAPLQFRRVMLDPIWMSSETRMSVGDLDGDGDLDLISPAGDGPNFAWYENIGGRLFEHRLYTGLQNATGVKLADIDNDADLDIVVTAPGRNLLLWMENRGSAGFVTWRIADTIKYPAYVSVADVNGDGRPDVVVSARDSNALYWYERNGNEWTQHTIDAALNLPLGVTTADLDHDGDVDVLVASSGDAKVFWYANNGSGAFQRRIVDVNLVNVRAIKVADLDGDGDLDVAAVAASEMNSVAVYLNDGAQNFTRQILQTGYLGSDLDVGDRNGNGKPDIVVGYNSGKQSDPDIVVFEQTQGSSFSTTVITSIIDNVQTVKLVDADGDGDLDLLVGAASAFSFALTPPLLLYTNNGGQFAQPVTIVANNPSRTISGIDAGNLDGDNSLEIVLMDSRNQALLRLDSDITGGAVAPSISFSATPAINVGDPVTLTWSTMNATTITIDNNVGEVAASGTFVRHNIAATTTFVLTATGPGGTRTATATVVVNNPLAAGITVVPRFIHVGESATLVWSSTGGTTVTINDGSGAQAVAASGTKSVSPTQSTHYTLAVQANNVTVVSSTDLIVASAPAPVITSFLATMTSIPSSAPVMLLWTSMGGTTATIDQGVGNVATSGMTIVTPATTTTYTLIVRGAGGTTARSVTIVVKNVTPPTVSTLAGNGQAGSTDGPSMSASFMKPFAVAAMPHNAGASSIGQLGGHPIDSDAAASFDLYILDSNHTIRRISSDGTTSTFAGSAGVRGAKNGFRSDATFDFSNYVGAIVANSDGSFEVVDANGVQRHIDTAGIVANICASCARFPLPAGVVRLADRTTYISDAGNHTITRIAASGTTTIIGRFGQPGLIDGAADQAEFNRPRGMTVDSAGNVYVLDTGNNAVRKISSANVVSTLSVTGTSTTGGELNLGCCASGIAPAPGGGVYVVDPDSNSVKQVSPSGSITTIAGSGSSGSTNGSGASASFNAPLGITTAPDGSLIVTDTNNNTIRSITPPPGSPRRRAVKH